MFILNYSKILSEGEDLQGRSSDWEKVCLTLLPSATFPLAVQPQFLDVFSHLWETWLQHPSWGRGSDRAGGKEKCKGKAACEGPQQALRADGAATLLKARKSGSG